jgi:hypothetical protein
LLERKSNYPGNSRVPAEGRDATLHFTALYNVALKKLGN